MTQKNSDRIELLVNNLRALIDDVDDLLDELEVEVENAKEDEFNE